MIDGAKGPFDVMSFIRLGFAAGILALSAGAGCQEALGRELYHNGGRPNPVIILQQMNRAIVRHNSYAFSIHGNSFTSAGGHETTKVLGELRFRPYAIRLQITTAIRKGAVVSRDSTESVAVGRRAVTLVRGRVTGCSGSEAGGPPDYLTGLLVQDRAGGHSVQLKVAGMIRLQHRLTWVVRHVWTFRRGTNMRRVVGQYYIDTGTNLLLRETWLVFARTGQSRFTADYHDYASTVHLTLPAVKELPSSCIKEWKRAGV